MRSQPPRRHRSSRRSSQCRPPACRLVEDVEWLHRGLTWQHDLVTPAASYCSRPLNSLPRSVSTASPRRSARTVGIHRSLTRVSPLAGAGGARRPARERAASRLGAGRARLRARAAGAGRGTDRAPARHLRPLRAALDLAADTRSARPHARAGRPARPATKHVPYVIERIRRERAAGKSLAAIANGLNADRIPTAQGGRRWYPAIIRHTLKRTS